MEKNGKPSIYLCMEAAKEYLQKLSKWMMALLYLTPLYHSDQKHLDAIVEGVCMCTSWVGGGRRGEEGRGGGGRREGEEGGRKGRRREGEEGGRRGEKGIPREITFKSFPSSCSCSTDSPNHCEGAGGEVGE